MNQRFWGMVYAALALITAFCMIFIAGYFSSVTMTVWFLLGLSMAAAGGMVLHNPSRGKRWHAASGIAVGSTFVLHVLLLAWSGNFMLTYLLFLSVPFLLVVGIVMMLGKGASSQPSKEPAAPAAKAELQSGARGQRRE